MEESPYTKSIKKLNVRTRNRLRPILRLQGSDAIARLNILRAELRPGALAQVESVLWAASSRADPIIPSLFPSAPQVREDYVRLKPLGLHEQFLLIAHHAAAHDEKLKRAIGLLAVINRKIVDRNYVGAALTLCDAYDEIGYSHVLLRKAALIRVLDANAVLPRELSELLNSDGQKRAPLIATSLAHCYQVEQDFLVLKRSIMSIPDYGSANKYTRDIARLPFQPFGKNEDDLRDMLQSAMQSSLLDALVVAKLNADLFPGHMPAAFGEIYSALEEAAPDLDQIVNLYDLNDSDSEHTFYKHTSAWLESSAIQRYRFLLDHFYDAPDSAYLNLAPNRVQEIAPLIGDNDLEDLARCARLTKDAPRALALMQQSGTATRSAVFNYLLRQHEGAAYVSEESLIALMGKTRDLAKTIWPDHVKNLAKASSSPLSKLVLYLLIAKRSRSEKDHFQLRKLVQQIVLANCDGSLEVLLEDLSKRSGVVATYAYEVFTEDFIAQLFHLVKSAADIAETRAALHRWMAGHTGERTYADRARTLLIDHQINKIRNELDDNRIYVDVGRFHQWIDDEIWGDLNNSLSSLDQRAAELDGLDATLQYLIGRCYKEFCSSPAFGIASYLGRRIRHGTFKGNLFNAVISIETQERYAALLDDANVRAIWVRWKKTYEERVDEIIQTRLHIESEAKKDGLLKPGSAATPMKSELIGACGRALQADFSENKTPARANQIITEYCWRLAEVDLVAFGAYLRRQRDRLQNASLLQEIRWARWGGADTLAGDFCREIVTRMDAQLKMMQTWFKKPLIAAPKASLGLLYRAVVDEVRTSFPNLVPAADVPGGEIELLGGAYHVIYDALYVIIYNAAKHGNPAGRVEAAFSILESGQFGRTLVAEIVSELRVDDSPVEIGRRLLEARELDIDGAQVYENRSGIPKLYQLQKGNPSFFVQEIKCEGRRVVVVLNHLLEH